MRNLALTAMVAAGVALTGCQSTDPAVRGAGRGAAIGAAGGALVGAVAGGVGVAEGAAAGAALGGIVGAAVGADGKKYQRDGQGGCYYYEENGRRVYVDRDRCH